MIRVIQQPEPNTFDAKVGRPGRAFLRSNPKPTSKQFASHSYWREILDLLHQSYKGICAYSCHWIPYDTGSDTVEHFLPKTAFPQRAYDWSNYRLVCGMLNGRKGKHRDVLDPFLINNGEFILKFPSLMVDPSPRLSTALQGKILQTIERLGLNDEGTCLKSRVKWVLDYCDNNISFEHLRVHAPFIALELQRQALVTDIKTIMRAQ